MSRYCHSVRCGRTCSNRRRSSSTTSAKRFCIVIRVSSSSIAAWKSGLKGCRPVLGALIAERISGVDSVAPCARILPGNRSSQPMRSSGSRSLFALHPCGTGTSLQSSPLSRPPLPHHDTQSGRGAGQACWPSNASRLNGVLLAAGSCADAQAGWSPARSELQPYYRRKSACARTRYRRLHGLLLKRRTAISTA